jgi:hypothetical protein
VWARVHKIDRIRPQPNGGAIVLVEDERSAANMARVPGLSTTIAIARVLNARFVLDAKYGGVGEIRYAANVTLPSFLFEAVVRAGAAVSDGSGEHVVCPGKPEGIEAIVDSAFSELAHVTRGNVGAADMITTLRRIEASRRKSPLDRELHPQLYWPAVFELASLAGELSRPRGGRWIETKEMPVPFAIKFTDSTSLATPAKLAQRIVEGENVEETLAT